MPPRPLVTPVRGYRNPLVTRVQMARKEMQMEDDDYRAILIRITGYDSSTKCSGDQLINVLAEFRRLGWDDPRNGPANPNPQSALICEYWSKLHRFLRRPDRDGLRAYVQRMTGVDDPDWLNAKQSNIIIEGLKSWLAREEAKEKRSCP